MDSKWGKSPQNELNRKWVVSFASGIAGSRCYKGMLSRLLYISSVFICSASFSVRLYLGGGKMFSSSSKSHLHSSASPRRGDSLPCLFLYLLCTESHWTDLGHVPRPNITYPSQDQGRMLAAPWKPHRPRVGSNGSSEGEQNADVTAKGSGREVVKKKKKVHLNC